MEKNGFEHRQYSVYTSKKPLNRANIYILSLTLAKTFPWLLPCINHLDVTNIGQQHDLLPTLQKFVMDEQQESEPQSK